MTKSCFLTRLNICFPSAPKVLPGSGEMESYNALSLNLCILLETLGISTDVRLIRKETATISEILDVIADIPGTNVYVLGSAYEGSFTLKMGSDMDFLHVCIIMPVVCQTMCMFDLPIRWGLLLIPDCTFPGYAKLQLLDDGKELFKNDPVGPQFTLPEDDVDFYVQLDSQNRQCFTFKYRSDAYVRSVNKQGPALQIKGDAKRMPTDYVLGFKCDTWPSLTTEWLTRKRKNGWPSRDHIQKMKTYGFIVVKAFHPRSNEKDLQWRISFSHQERELVVTFNEAQMKCYVLLKLIKNDIIKKTIGEETLTSYHCKTCIFYMLENMSNDLWIPKNLASCLLMCLRQIRMWVKKGNCPNYFIPGENMFDRISNEDLRLKLFEILDKITKSDLGRLILTITTDGIGETLKHFDISKLRSTDTVLLPNHIDECMRREVSNLIIRLAEIRNFILREQYNRNIAIFNENIRILMNKLRQTRSFSDHTKEEETAKYLIMPFLQLALLSSTTVKQLCDGDEEIRKTLESRQWDELEPIAKLKQASIFLALNDNKASLHTLLKVAQSVRFHFCSCYPFQPVYPSKAAFSTITEYALKEAVVELLRHALLPCVSFLPCEQLITPCIRYEMIRRFGVPIADMLLNFYWFDWGMVDGTFLTVFLLYLNHDALGQTSDATKCVKKMIQFLNEGIISHRETCLNLLGWVHRKRGNVRLAVQCFTKSLKERPMYNAACWHLLFTICGP